MRRTIDTWQPIFLPDPVNRQHDLNRGRVAWWLTLPGLSGGRQWYDLMGLHHGTLTGMTTSASGWRGTTRPGGWGHLSFDEINDHVVGPASPLWSGPLGTVSVWVKLARIPSLAVFIGCSNAAQSGGWQFGIQSIVSWRQWTPEVNTWGIAPLVGVWNQYAAAWDGSLLRLYHDGQLYHSQAIGAPTQVTTSLAVGIDSRDFGGQPFPGDMDDLSIWDRPLSAVDVRDLFDESRAGYPGTLNRFGSRVAVFDIGAAAFRPAWAAGSNVFLCVGAA